MKLLVYTIGGQKIGIDILTWNDAMLSGNTAFMDFADTGSTPTNYVDISSTVYWDRFGTQTTLTDAEIKNEIIKLIPDIPTAQEYEILEGYMNVGINTMTNVGEHISFSSEAIPDTLSGVTDNKLTVIESSVPGNLIFLDKITGTTATFTENMNIDGQLNFDHAQQINTTGEFIRIRYNAISGIPGFSGLAMMNADGAGNNFLMGVDYTGIMVGGWSGSTLNPIATGSTTGGMTTYSTTNPNTITTASATDVLLTGMQITSVPAGDYFLSFGTSLEHSSNSDQIFTNIYVGGTIVTGSEQHWRRGAAQGDVSSTHNYSSFPITLASTSTVDIRWRTDSATASAENPYMTLIKV